MVDNKLLPHDLDEALRRVLGKIADPYSETGTYANSIASPAINKRRAKRSRADRLQQLILEIVKKKPRITTAELLRELDLYLYVGAIKFISDDGIEWVSARGNLKFTEISSLKYRLRRARKMVNGGANG